MKVYRCVWEGGEWGSNWEIDLPRKKLPSKNPALLELNPIQLETFEKILLKLGPSNIALICRVYETRFITRQPEMFKRDLLNKSHVKPGPSNMVLVCSVY